MPEISPKAIVSNPAGLAEDVRVGPFCLIGPDVSVGPGTVIANNVTITGRTSIGAGCRLFPGCIVGCPPDGSTDADSAGACTIADANVLREYVVLEAGSALGENNLLMVGCQVGHGAKLEGEGHFVNYTRIEHHARIEKFVRTSGFDYVGPYATVGAYTFTTGYVCVDRDAPPYAIIQGHPFRVRSLNTENLRRCGFRPKTIELLKEAFRMLFDGRCDFPAPDRLSSVEQAFDDENVRYLVESIRRSSANPAGRCLHPPE